MQRTTLTWGPSVGIRSTNLFVNESAGARVPIMDRSQYDTFISHKGNDLTLAAEAGEILYRHGLHGYLDVWDPKVDGDSAELEEYLRQVIRETPSILAVVTEHTSTSWWVPFEIGVARETESVIATYLQVDENRTVARELPSYLKTWPILGSVDISP